MRNIKYVGVTTERGSELFESDLNTFRVQEDRLKIVRNGITMIDIRIIDLRKMVVHEVFVRNDGSFEDLGTSDIESLVIKTVEVEE